MTIATKRPLIKPVKQKGIGRAYHRKTHEMITMSTIAHAESDIEQQDAKEAQEAKALEAKDKAAALHHDPTKCANRCGLKLSKWDIEHGKTICMFCQADIDQAKRRREKMLAEMEARAKAKAEAEAHPAPSEPTPVAPQNALPTVNAMLAAMRDSPKNGNKVIIKQPVKRKRDRKGRYVKKSKDGRVK
jgi:hypothetical protein